MIDTFNLKFLEKTKWNEIYENNTHVFIFNTEVRTWKIKPR